MKILFEKLFRSKMTANGAAKVSFALVLFLSTIEFSFWLLNYETLAEINIFFVRDFQRSMAISQGHFILEGPDTSAGGYILGPFFYLLMLPSTIFGHTYDAAILWIAFLRALSHSALAIFFFRDNRKAAILLWGILAVHPAIVFSMRWSNNASLIDLFFCWGVLFSTWGLERSDRFSKKLWYPFLQGLLIGLACQIHYTGLVLGFILIYTHRKWSKNSFFSDLFTHAIGWLIPQLPLLIKWMFFAEYSIFMPNLGPTFHLGFHFPTFIFDPIFLLFLKLYLIRADNLSAIWVLLMGLVLSVFFREPPKNHWLALNRRLLPILCLVTLPYVLNMIAIRYSTHVLLFVFLHLVQRFHLTKKSVFLLFLASGIPFYFSQSVVYSKEVNIQELSAFADYFNKKEIPFWQAERATQQITAWDEEGGFVLSEPYFHTPPNHPSKLSNRYLVVNERFIPSSQNIADLLLPKEFKESLLSAQSSGKVTKHALSPRFYLYEWPDPSLDLEERRSNLTNVYLYDRVWRKRSGAQIWRLCSLPYFCDLEINYAVRNRDLFIRISGRPISVRSLVLPPATALLTNVNISYRCGEKEVKSTLAEKIGMYQQGGSEDNFDKYYADFISKTKLPCDQFNSLSLFSERIDITFEPGTKANASDERSVNILENARISVEDLQGI